MKNMFFVEHIGTTISLKTVSLKTVPIAIANDISKAYYQKEFVICFLSSIYGRFMEYLIGAL